MSRFSYTLRLSMLVRETLMRIGTDVSVRIGEVLPFEALGVKTSPKELAARLQAMTYAM